MRVKTSSAIISLRMKSGSKQTPRSVSIRPYSPEDCASIKQILEDGGLFYEKIDNEERMREKVARDPQSILVATEASQIIGTVSLMEDGRMAFIFRLGVKAEHRGHGVGTALMVEAEHILHERGYDEVHILVAQEDTELQGYYERIGYERGHAYQWMHKQF